MEGADFFFVRPKSVYLAGSFLICATLSFRRYHTFAGIRSRQKNVCLSIYEEEHLPDTKRLCWDPGVWNDYVLCLLFWQTKHIQPIHIHLVNSRGNSHSNLRQCVYK